MDHLERHENLNKYANAKIKLICDQDKNKYSFIEKESKIINKLILNKNIRSKLIKINYNKANFLSKKLRTAIYLIKII